MQIMYFTERPYKEVPEDEVLRNRSFFGVSNSLLRSRRWAPASTTNTSTRPSMRKKSGSTRSCSTSITAHPYCMGAVMNVEAAILARVTKQGPHRAARAIRCRWSSIRCGWPRSWRKSTSSRMAGWCPDGCAAPAASRSSINANPAYNREYFNEAHDLVIACWTRPGPFRWEGKHFNYPLRQSVGAAVPEAPSADLDSGPDQRRDRRLVRAASLPLHRIGHRAAVDGRVVEPLRPDIAAKEGYLAGSENFGYLQHSFVAETEEKAQKQGRRHLFGGGGANFSRPEWTLPPGYNSKEANRRLAKQRDRLRVSGHHFGKAEGSRRRAARRHRTGRPATRAAIAHSRSSIEEARARRSMPIPKGAGRLQIIIGTPKTVIPKLRRIMEVLRPGVFATVPGTKARSTSKAPDQHPPDGCGGAAGDARVSPRNWGSSIRSSACRARGPTSRAPVAIRWSIAKRSNARRPKCRAGVPALSSRATHNAGSARLTLAGAAANRSGGKPMIMTYFTERPYRDVAEDEVFKNQAFFGLSNKFFDREAGARLYNEYLDEAVLRRGDGLRRDDAQRASWHPVLHGRGDERRGVDPRAHHQESSRSR